LAAPSFSFSIDLIYVFSFPARAFLCGAGIQIQGLFSLTRFAAWMESLSRFIVRVYFEAICPPRHPYFASSSDSVNPLFASRVALAFRRPCADFRIPAAQQASLNQFPKDSLTF